MSKQKKTGGAGRSNLLVDLFRKNRWAVSA